MKALARLSQSRRLFVETCAWSQWALLQQADFSKSNDWAQISQAVCCCIENYSVAYSAYARGRKHPSWLMLLRKTSRMFFIPASPFTPAMPLSLQQQQQQSSHYSELSSSQAGSSLAPSPWLQVLPVLVQWSEPTFPEWLSPHSVTLSPVHGTHLSGSSFTVQCTDLPSETQRVNAV